ncbi:MAG: hypothetical protein N2110_02750 [Flavobacteriales bacterium]|nr:hypothetical protein [Flavobacteriales bacterium]MCX7767925.1 hypothetical protein [Flavobacteriales bacterium]MDW8409329.1 hypothetical protein [Flavobacteriales bacterium]
MSRGLKYYLAVSLIFWTALTIFLSVAAGLEVTRKGWRLSMWYCGLAAFALVVTLQRVRRLMRYRSPE